MAARVTPRAVAENRMHNPIRSADPVGMAEVGGTIPEIAGDSSALTKLRPNAPADYCAAIAAGAATAPLPSGARIRSSTIRLTSCVRPASPDLR